MKCGQIVLVDYPFTDSSGSKVRPVLVVSVDEYNKGEDLVVVPISSVPDPDDLHAYQIPADASWFIQTRLRQASSVKWTKPLTISRRVVRRRLGTVPSGPLSEIQSKVQGIFRF